MVGGWTRNVTEDLWSLRAEMQALRLRTPQSAATYFAQDDNVYLI
jgi:hypothetical protein